MATFASGQGRSQRGSPPGLRFFVYASLAIALMYLDQRGGWLERVRYGLQAAAYPLQLAMNSPSAAWNWTRSIFEARADLQQENRQLRQTIRRLELLSLRHAALERENATLRGLRGPLPGLAEKWLPGEVIGAESTALRQRLTLRRGAVHGVFKGQTVVAGGGVLGQTLRVGPWSSEVILVSDPEHALPVQVVRNGLRTLAVGTGEANSLSLPYLPIQSDIRDGDVLVTSGLGGVFPAGYPVARVTSVRRDGSSPLAQVRAQPLAGMDRDRVVALLWFTPAHPDSPAPAPDANAPPVAGAAMAVPPPPVTAAPAASPAAPPAGDSQQPAPQPATPEPAAAAAVTEPPAAQPAPAQPAPAQPAPAQPPAESPPAEPSR